MKIIWKYPLEITDEQEITLPRKSEFLPVLEQYNHPVIYFLVDPNNIPLMTKIYIIGTGNPVPMDILERTNFLGTASTHGGSLIWHIFIEKK